MAEFEKFENILLVTGSDLFDTGDDYRDKLKAYLYDDSEGAKPVSKGSHDFWIIYSLPPQGGGEHSREDMECWPRKMRGIVQMGGVPPDTNDATMIGQIHTIAQEVAHHWLVPQDLAFNVAGLPIGILDAKELTRLFNEGQLEFEKPLILGRTENHWSAYFQGEGSPMDGTNYDIRNDEGGFDRWTHQFPVGPEITPADLPTLRLFGIYNDLDLVIMGVKAPHEAYRSSGGAVRWVEPRLTVPFTYHIGVSVVFSEFDFFYFGFYKDYRTLAVERTDGSDRDIIDLGRDYHPLEHDLNGVALRVIRRGNRYYFQVRYDYPPLSPDSLLEDIDPIPGLDPHPPFDDYKTVAIKDAADTPQAVGLIVKRWSHPHLAEGAFSGFAIQAGRRQTIFSTDHVPLPMTSYIDLPDDALRIENPTGKAVFRSDSASNRLFITAPYSIYVSAERDLDNDTRFNHTSTVNEAPKVLLSAPDGDFAFGTSCKVYRTIFRPWTGGGAENKIVWGKSKSIPISDVVLPDYIEVKHQKDSDTCAYRMAFILVVRERNNVTPEMIRRLDVTRRYWMEAFPEYTAGRRQADTSLNCMWKLLGATPMFGHVNGWSGPQYYKTIRLADINGDGMGDTQQVSLIARGARGLVTYGWNDSRWIFDGDPPSKLTDSQGWNKAQYYETIKLADVDGDGRSELIARGADGIHTFDWGGRWIPSDVSPILNDAQGWDQPQYYASIGLANVTGDESDGRKQTELVARGANGIVTYHWDGRAWGMIGSPVEIFSDSEGWDQPEYYKTFRLADIDGDGRAELIARGANGIVTLNWNGGEWEHVDTAAHLTDAQGWNQPYYYEMIGLANVTGSESDGRRQVELVARGANGITTLRWNGSTWDSFDSLLEDTFSDTLLWNRPEYYRTIRLADVDGDGKAELVARGPQGVVTYHWVCGWIFRGSVPILTDAQGWNKPQFYETIRLADIDGDGKAELFARGWNNVWVFRAE